MEIPFIRIEDSGAVCPLGLSVTTIGRGRHVDIRLTDPSVSQLHAEIVRRGPYAYVIDFGLSRNGTRVNGRLVAQRLLAEGDVVTFGSARCRIGGLLTEECSGEVQLRKSATPELTRRELDVVSSLCRPALTDEAFVAPTAARQIAAELVVTEAAVKQHLLRLYQKFRIAAGPERRVRLANELVTLGLVRPLPPRPDPAGSSPPAAAAAPGAFPPGTAQPGLVAPGTAQPGAVQPGLFAPGHVSAGPPVAAMGSPGAAISGTPVPGTPVPGAAVPAPRDRRPAAR